MVTLYHSVYIKGTEDGGDMEEERGGEVGERHKNSEMWKGGTEKEGRECSHFLFVIKDNRGLLS